MSTSTSTHTHTVDCAVKMVTTNDGTWTTQSAEYACQDATTDDATYHVVFDVPDSMRHLLTEDLGIPWDYCAVGLPSIEEAERVAAHADRIECHGPGIKHHVMSDAEVMKP